MSIPKIIHYCWFGRGKKPELAEKCIASWKKYCPDYEIIEWNEDNFDVNELDFTKEAYENRKYAFVTDYVRLKVMHEFGGIYMDTDVEVIKPLDRFLNCDAFSGFESKDRLPTGIMACSKGFELFEQLMSYYDDRHFQNENGDLDMTTNVSIITGQLIAKGVVNNGSYQTVSGFTLFPAEYFCPKDYKSGKIRITSNTYTIHHFDGSWQSDQEKEYMRKYRKVTRVLGDRWGEYWLISQKVIKEYGVKEFIKRIWKRVCHK